MAARGSGREKPIPSTSCITASMTLVDGTCMLQPSNAQVAPRGLAAFFLPVSTALALAGASLASLPFSFPLQSRRDVTRRRPRFRRAASHHHHHRRQPPPHLQSHLGILLLPLPIVLSPRSTLAPAPHSP